MNTEQLTQRVFGDARLLALVLLSFLAGTTDSNAQSVQPGYVVSALPAIGGTARAAVAIDDTGFPVVAANGETTNGLARGFAGNSRVLRDIGTFGGARSEVRALHAWMVVGAGETAAGAMHALLQPAGSAPIDLGTLGGTSSVALGVFPPSIVGASQVAGDGAMRPFVYDLQSGRLRELPVALGGRNAIATAVNGVGHVVGYADLATGSGALAYRLADGVAQDLGTLGGSSEAFAINAVDVVAGRSQVGADGPWHAFRHADGILRDLGTLGGAASEGTDINDAGAIVGWAEDADGTRRAAIWRDDIAVDLNVLIAVDSGWILEAATGISDLGAIVGFGMLDGERRAFMLTPPMDVRLDLRSHSNQVDTNRPNPHEAGQPLLLGATVFSNGPFSVFGVTVVLTFTGPVEVVSWSGAICEVTGLTVTCHLGPFDFEQDVFVTLRATGPGIITHEAAIAADFPDPNPANNSARESNRAVSLATLSLAAAAATGGTPVLARTTLTSSTPSGGATVQLTSSHPELASVPSQFDVLPWCCDGGLWREFYVRTVPVLAPTVVEITASYGLVSRTESLTILPPDGVSWPFGGTPAGVPGQIEAEQFDQGGEGLAYHDLSDGNEGGVYRDTGVDLAAAEDIDDGYTVGWIAASEWLAYTVDVTAGGTYSLSARVASDGPGGTFHVEINGIDRTRAIHVPDTGGWQVWTTVTTRGVVLTAGVQRLRIVMDTAGPNSAVGNINWLRIDNGQTPFSGTAAVVPGDIEAERFDDGGAGVAYHDGDAGNNGGGYRDTDVDIAPADDDGGGYTVGWIGAGEWIAYSVDVASAGTYLLEARVASAGPGGTFHVEVDGADATGALLVPDTGGWQSWTTIGRSGVVMPAGRHVLRLVMDTAGVSEAIGNINWLRFTSDVVAAPFTIVSPEPGETLRTAAVTFAWSGDGDEFWLEIGSAPEQQDVYTSGSLGAVHGHRVSALPLNGAPLHVQLRRRLGTAIETRAFQYIAAHRRALAVIVDFADRRLEDWGGAGIKDEADLRVQLDEQEAHWTWLSHGRERLQWDIARIQLPEAAVPGAYAGWWDFRNDVGDRTRQQVDLNDYDVNGDGVLDISWAVVSSGDVSVPFVVGGASMNAGVNLFVDGQASTSVVGGVTGNFTHETGHLLGIPDLYGPYGTLGSLTVMSYSWDLPPGDFTAFERQILGWVQPVVVGQSTRNLWLPEAHEQLAAVKIPTGRANEYFLVEYRRKPAAGFGSADISYNGLLITHVLEGSSMWQDPPVLRVEPADRVSAPSQPTDAFDLFYPGHPMWTPPAIFRSYADGQPVFTLDRVSWLDGGMSFDVSLATAQSVRPVTTMRP